VTEAEDRADVVIVGAGPAGLSAAIALKARGVGRVVALDREAEAGGIPRHCAHYPYGLREFRRLMKGPAYAARLVAEARAAGVEIATGATVASLEPGPALTVSTGSGLARITARAVLLATGVRETSRAQRLIGGTKPGGVLSTGALQGLVHLDGLRPFERPLVLGTELVAFSALLTCRHLGIRPRAMIEPGPRPVARWPAGLFPRLVGVDLLLRTGLEAIHGGDRVEAVTLRGPDGAARRLETDGVIVSGGFRPESALLADGPLERDPATGGPVVDQFGRCSEPGFFAAGNMLHPVETAGWCWREARAVGHAIADHLEGRLPPAEGALRLRAEGDALAYVAPQRLTPGGSGALERLQIRLRRPARGRLVLSGPDGRVDLGRIDSRPERRIGLAPPRRVGAGEARLTIEEDA
jgi:thioredoxin reductase